MSLRELEVLKLLARGCKIRKIALALDIQECTVRFHVGNILDRLRVRNRTKAVYRYFRNGWLTD